jgi:DNA-binding CsgD family transcriptional regulator
VTGIEPAVTSGMRALERGEWETARAAFELVPDDDATPEVLDGLARALWWQADIGQAVSYRARAFRAFRSRGDVAVAARIAYWLAREYRGVLCNPAAADGWFARCQRLVEELPAGAAHGWLDLARVDRTGEPSVQERYADSAYRCAREFDDPDLEIYALAARGLARTTAGAVDDGIADLDAALATALDASSPDTVGDALCTMMLAAEMVADADRFSQWNEALEQYMATHQHINLTGFCFTCCGEVFVVNGQWDEADEWFRTAIRALERTGHRSRCAHPVTRLARLRVRQGRLEEAEALLAEFRDLPEAVEPLAALMHARGHPAAAIELAERRLARIGDETIPAVPLLSLLVEAQLAVHSLDGARRISGKLAELAERSDLDRVRGLAALASGRVAHAEGRADDAHVGLTSALAAFERAGMPAETAIVHRELAQLAADAGTFDVAGEEGKAALHAFEQSGAAREADETAAFLRSIGVRGQTGPKGLGVLSRREREVLDLVAAGLSNAEIAERLFISVKTAGNHVSNVLTKLGVRTRTEAAALALHQASDRH